MPVHIEAGITNVILIVKQLDRGSQLDQDVGLLFLYKEIDALGVFLLFRLRRFSRRLPHRRAVALLDHPRTGGICGKPVRNVALGRQSGQANNLNSLGDRKKGARNALAPLTSLFVIVLMEVDDSTAEVLVEIVRPVARALAVGRGNEPWPSCPRPFRLR